MWCWRYISEKNPQNEYKVGQSDLDDKNSKNDLLSNKEQIIDQSNNSYVCVNFPDDTVDEEAIDDEKYWNELIKKQNINDNDSIGNLSEDLSCLSQPIQVNYEKKNNRLWIRSS